MEFFLILPFSYNHIIKMSLVTMMVHMRLMISTKKRLTQLDELGTTMFERVHDNYSSYC